MNRVPRLAFAIVLLCFCTPLLPVGRPLHGQVGRHQVEVLWDSFGIPHVYGEQLEDVFYGFGWSQMNSHADLILHLYGEARGRAAEYWGEGPVTTARTRGARAKNPILRVAQDRWIRTVGIPERAAQWYGEQDPEFKPLLDAFVAGMNAYLREHPDAVPPESRAVLPVTPVDVLAHINRVFHFEFLTSPAIQKLNADQWQQEKGSNAAAIGPKRSASGHPILVTNPHLGWAPLFTWTEAQLVGPGLDGYGATWVGTPMLMLAFNDDLGWTHTANTIDGADEYELTLKGDGYQWDGAVKRFEVDEQRLKIRQPDGSFKEETLTIRRSVHGPVVAERPGHALALRVSGLDQPNLASEYLQLIRARNLAQFETALRRLQIPLMSVIYADRAGHIMHVFGGRVPVRPSCSCNWAGVVPGVESATLWTATYPYEKLPRVLDPPGQWLQNCNEPPWLTTFPPAIDPKDYPAGIAPLGMGFRAQRGAHMWGEDPQITLDAAIAYKHSTRVEVADRLLDDLAAAVKAHQSPTATRAWAVLDHWDRQVDASSRGAVLFTAFFDELTRVSGSTAKLFAQPWDPKRPRETPDGLADPAAAVKALETAAAKVEHDYGALDVPWGDVYRIRRDGLDLPASGGPGPMGIYRAMGFAPTGDGKFDISSGDTFESVVEFGSPIRARAVMGYGNASQPGSPHRTDQLRLYAEKQMRPVWRTRGEIQTHLERRDVLNPGPR
jgi:acyl-homoserine-lactone acylase